MVNNSNFRIVAYGEILWDILPDGPVLGGALFNFTNRVNELGNEGILISKLGADNFGKDALEGMKKLHLDTSYIQRDLDHPTGTVKVTLDENHNPDYEIIKDVAYDFITTENRQKVLVSEADCLCFGSLIQRQKSSRDTLYQLIESFNGRYIFYDINLRKDCYTDQIIQRSLQHANILKLNKDELVFLNENFQMNKVDLSSMASAIRDRFDLKYCVVTLGDEGVFVVSDRDEKVYMPSFQVEVIEPIGAGDAFTAAFAHSLLNNQPLEECCKFGNLIGAIVAGQRGATQAITPAMIDRFKSNISFGKINRELVDYQPS